MRRRHGPRIVVDQRGEAAQISPIARIARLGEMQQKQLLVGGDCARASAAEVLLNCLHGCFSFPTLYKRPDLLLRPLLSRSRRIRNERGNWNRVSDGPIRAKKD